MRPTPSRLVEAQGNACNLTYHFNLIGVKIRFGITIGGRVRLYGELSVFQRAPATRVASAVLQEINGALEFVGPPTRNNPAFGIVDHDQGTGWDDWKHGPIFGSD